MSRLIALTAGQQVVFGGDQVVEVSAELADAFQVGDRLVVVQEDGALLHIPANEHAIVDAAVTAARTGFAELAAVTDDAISDFFEHFAARLADDAVFAPIAVANALDIDRARERGRSTTRLELSAAMRADMVAGLRGWRDASVSRDEIVRTIEHEGWSVEARRAPLGVVGFVFEGRPNVFADACGVVRSGNAVVFRIGSDALGTALAIVEHALRPALAESGLPDGIVQLVESAAHSAGHALFSDRRLALAVARGSGAAVAQLGAVASQSGVPVSLHGTGGAWIVAGEHADADTLHAVVQHSLDRKVCNTLNVCAIPAGRAAELIPAFLAGLDAAGAARLTTPRLHVVDGSAAFLPPELFDRSVDVDRASGTVTECYATVLPESDLAIEWEWENSPEVTLVVVDDVDQAVVLCNTYSPHFTASLVSSDLHEHDHFYGAIDAPFVGNGFTRWVDGQYALDAPELGLSNWQGGRMLGRGAILSGDSVHTVRYRATVTDHQTHR
ncbi:aldehyde dehydrogenase family protein [Ilumatobacter sp.]|uniref:aldehyde dehydrogenase family protein n=1 Tax=Ilumatobacter sp. TaxID=1967498 RepID=UPI0037513FDE|nr:aldehyde dehydrogenase family protein [Ilumatobacter sp.]